MKWICRGSLSKVLGYPAWHIFSRVCLVLLFADFKWQKKRRGKADRSRQVSIEKGRHRLRNYSARIKRLPWNTSISIPDIDSSVSLSFSTRNRLIVVRYTSLYTPRIPSAIRSDGRRARAINPAPFSRAEKLRCINFSRASETCFARETSDALMSWGTGELSTHRASPNSSNALRSRPPRRSFPRFTSDYAVAPAASIRSFREG